MGAPNFRNIIKSSLLPEAWHENIISLLRTVYNLGAPEKWIRVEDELPVKTGYYITYGNGAVSVKHFNIDDKTWHTPLGPITYVTDWQEMPLKPSYRTNGK